MSDLPPGVPEPIFPTGTDAPTDYDMALTVHSDALIAVWSVRAWSRCCGDSPDFMDIDTVIDLN